MPNIDYDYLKYSECIQVTYDSANGPNKRDPTRMPAINPVCAICTKLALPQTRSNCEKTKETGVITVDPRKIYFHGIIQTLITKHIVITQTSTYISDYGGFIHRPVVHPSILALCGLIQSIFPDGVDVPVHRDEHVTPAEGPIRHPRNGQVSLLLWG